MKMKAALRAGISLSILAVLTACGGGGDDGSTTDEATVSTLAYVVTQCRADAGTLTIRQSLQIRRGEHVPITVVEHAAVVPDSEFYCERVGVDRQGALFAELGVFRRLGVTPDGSQVVFEVTDEVTEGIVFPLVFPRNALPSEEKGIFVVGADGSGLRRLGPASRVGSFFLSYFAFSPSGRLVAYTDEGPGTNNPNAVQIFTLDLLTGDRRQVTQLPRVIGVFGGTYQPFFNDDQTITFSTRANADGQHPFGANLVVTVNTDGSRLTVAPPVIALPGAEVLTRFRITGSELDAAVLTLPGPPVNPGIGNTGSFAIQEVFDIDRENNVLQLTNFRRVDTYSPTVSGDGQRVLFSASANPPELGTNPTENCQIFSIDRTGGNLRQLTNFHEVSAGQLSSAGCSPYPRPFGCGAYFTTRDIRTDTVLFDSSCDPFGTNPNGSQIFAIHSDGTGLRQLTTSRGYEQDASGVVTVEIAFPFAWPGFQVRNQL